MKKIFVFLFLLLFPTMSFAIVDTTKVSINEAVELAKKYATSEDASFINGILGSIAKAQKTEA